MNMNMNMAHSVIYDWLDAFEKVIPLYLQFWRYKGIYKNCRDLSWNLIQIL